VRRAWLGIGAEEVLIPAAIAEQFRLSAPRGVSVRSVEAGSPAQKAGIAPRDVLTALGGKPITSVADLHRLLDHEAIGALLVLDTLRQREPRRVKIQPIEQGARQ
jgi:serine protease Do/serine protease DegQ